MTASQLYRNLQPLRNIYLHLPFCLKKCHFCAFPIHVIGSTQRNFNLMNQYLDYLSQQIYFSHQYATLQPKLQSIYLGGGTPSLYHPESIFRLIQLIGHEPQEITLESNVSEIHKLKEFQEAGVNRISIGIQTFNPQELSKQNRSFSSLGEDLFDHILRQLDAYRPSRLNFDFILDLSPKQQDLNKILSLIKKVRPEHVTLYLLEINEGSQIFKNPSLHSLLPEQDLVHKFIWLSKELSLLEYDHYQVSNFGLGSNKINRSKHNQAYWEGDRQFGAYGMGAASLINGRRITRPKSLKKYFGFVQNLDKEQNLEGLIIVDQNGKQGLESVIMSSLRRREGLSWERMRTIMEKKGGIFQKIKREMIQVLLNLKEQRNDLLEWESLDEAIRLSRPIGFLFVDEIAHRLISVL